MCGVIFGFVGQIDEIVRRIKAEMQQEMRVVATGGMAESIVSLCKEEENSAVISCGSTGGFLTTASLVLKNIPGVLRAALVAALPTKIKGKKVIILDVGASNENNANQLVQFAKMGRLYYQAVYGVKEPSVYLLSNGSESGKGSPLVKETFSLLENEKFPNFKGNIEARDVLNGEAEVVVADGFTGNVFLKSSEGVAKMMKNMIKDVFKRNFISKIGYLHVRKGIKEMGETMDYKGTGGGLMVGVNGVVVKAHGNSDAYSFESALNVLYSLAKANIVNKIKQEMK